MQELLTNRHAQLKAEFDKGRARLTELEEQVREVQHTLLRISGAIQVLEELMRVEPGGNGCTLTDSGQAPAADHEPGISVGRRP
jgi:hypothetical protein